MARVNRTPSSKPPARTHEGGIAARLTPLQELERTVLSCLLWEDGFYESGKTVADRIKALVPKCLPSFVSGLAIRARTDYGLRHVALLLARELARHPGLGSHPRERGLVGDTIAVVVQRADELAEFLALYWAEGKQPLAHQVKRGLRLAFTKFSWFDLAKYNRDHAIKLRDAMFLSHPKPRPSTRPEDEGLSPAMAGHPAVETITRKNGTKTRRHYIGQGGAFRQLAENELPVPDTWEAAISAAGKDKDAKAAEWTRLLTENRLGVFALVRNLRNLIESGVDDAIIRAALTTKIADARPSLMFPYRFMAAIQFAPRFTAELEALMLKAAAAMPKLAGETIVLVDVSGSMDDKLSSKSEMTRMDAAIGVAIAAREVCERVRVFVFSDQCAELNPYRGLGLAPAIKGALPHGSTYLRRSLEWMHAGPAKRYDRIIVITDEQTHDGIAPPVNGSKGYVINVASNQNGVGYGQWTNITGFSEGVLRYIAEWERATVNPEPAPAA